MFFSRLVSIPAAVAVLLLSLASCEKRTYQSIEELDNENINNYIRENQLNVQRYKNTDLFFEVLRPGTGRELSFREEYPLVYTVRSLDGTYLATDTFSVNNRYVDFLGYFPFGSVAAGTPNSPVEREDDLKYVVRDILQRSNGQIRILVPSRLTAWGRQGSRPLGIPSNASLDYTITIHDAVESYEDAVIRKAIVQAGFSPDQFVKTEEDIYYRILQQGTGDFITADSTVTVNYVLRNVAGEQMESNSDVRINLAFGTIPAWTKTLPLIQKGGKIRFFTPSKHAYGIHGGNGVAPFMSLDFEIDLK